jgi:hypothetical protein
MGEAALSSQRQTLLEKDGAELRQGIVSELDVLYSEIVRLREELAALRRERALNGSAVHLATSVEVEADEQLGAGQGFYSVEHAEDGQAFCWTGPSPQFTFDMRVERTKGAHLKMEGLFFLDFARQQNLQLSVDGTPVPVTVAKEDPGVVITAELPPKAGDDTTHVAFQLPEMLSPPNSEDKRLLGLAFVSLTVTSH